MQEQQRVQPTPDRAVAALEAQEKELMSCFESDLRDIAQAMVEARQVHERRMAEVSLTYLRALNVIRAELDKARKRREGC